MAEPSAVPPSCGDGGINTFLNPDSRRRRPFATQFSAVPPAKQRVVLFVCFLSHAANFKIASSKQSWPAAARSAHNSKLPLPSVKYRKLVSSSKISSHSFGIKTFSPFTSRGGRLSLRGLPYGARPITLPSHPDPAKRVAVK